MVKPAKPVKLTKEMLQATIGRDRNSVLKCLDRYRPLLPAGAGAVNVKWVVELSGDTSSIEVLDPALKGTALETCVLKGVKTFKFPRNVGPVRSMSIGFTYKGNAE